MNTDYRTLTYEVTGAIARITFDRPEHGNAITSDTPIELASAVERADLDPAVHVILLSGRGKGFCGGYDLSIFAEGMARDAGDPSDLSDPSDASGEAGGSVLDPGVQARNHDPRVTWDPMVDYAMMSRFNRGFSSLLHANKPTVAKLHGFAVAGGTDIALFADLIVCADDTRIGYPPARVWGIRLPGCGRTGSATNAPSACCSQATSSRGGRHTSGGSRSTHLRRRNWTTAPRTSSGGSRGCRSTSS